MARKFVLQLKTEAGTIELVAQRAKSLHEALQDFSRKVPAVGVDEYAEATVMVVDRSLQYRPLNITLDGAVNETTPVSLEPIPVLALDFGVRLVALCEAISKDPWFADLVDTKRYQVLLDRATNNTSIKIGLWRCELQDSIQAYIKERHITTLK